MGYHKKLNGVYISNVTLTTIAPKHWVTTLAYLSYQTADRPSFDRIVKELKKEGRSKKIENFRWEYNHYRPHSTHDDLTP